MSTFYTRSLQDLPKITISDVNRLMKAWSSTPRSKREKGYKMYLSSYIDNYEGKLETVQNDSIASQPTVAT